MKINYIAIRYRSTIGSAGGVRVSEPGDRHGLGRRTARANLHFDTFRKATDLHKRIAFTLFAMVVYRLGTSIPIPGINLAAFEAAFQGQSKGILGMFNMFSGGAVQRMAVFSLNVMPYISASIIVQLMGTMYPPWEKLRKEGGEAGRKTLNQYTRYLTVVLGVLQAFGIAVGLRTSVR